MNRALTFTDKQMRMVTEAARRVEPFHRQKFLLVLTEHLTGAPTDAAVERACSIALTTLKREARDAAFRHQMDG